MDQSLQGKTALITGASSGLGARFARVLATAGARVIITARRADRLDKLADEISADGGEVLHETLDVTRLDSLPDFYENLSARGWTPDILINNAGMNISKPALETSPEEYRQILGTNLDAPFFLATEFARRCIADGRAGRIINISSVGGFTVLPGLTPYCMSKSGLVMMTRGLAREWARHDLSLIHI